MWLEIKKQKSHVGTDYICPFFIEEKYITEGKIIQTKKKKSLPTLEFFISNKIYP